MRTHANGTTNLVLALRVSEGPPLVIPKRFGFPEKRKVGKATNAATSPILRRLRFAVWIPASRARPDIR
jgi:hypothetical protein